MPLQEIDPNTVAIPRILHSSSSNKRKRGEGNSNNGSGTTHWTSNELRSFVCGLRVLSHESYAEIESKTGVKQVIAFKIVRQAKAAVSSDESFEVIVCSIHQIPPGKTPKIVDGTADSAHIRFQILKDNITEWHIVAKKAGYQLSRHTVENIVKEHRNEANPYAIKWGVRSSKPHLGPFDEQIREEYCEWVIIQLDNGAIFIFSDETYIEIGGSPRKKQKVSRFVGASAELYAVAQPPVQFCIMLWGACCEDERVERFAHCWVLPETAEQKQDHKEEFRKENLERAEYAEWQRKQAIIPETDEYVELQQVNDRINQYNVTVIARNGEVKSKYGKGMKRFMTPRRLFVYEELTRGEGGGIDWFLYRKYILRPHLYFYYLAIRELNPDRKIYLVEDGAGAHVKAVVVDAQYRKKHGILSASHSVNSPDLHSIEDVWSYEKDSLDEYNLGRNGVSEDAQIKAKEIVLKEWREGQTKAVTNICQRFRRKCEQCIRVGGSNKFKG